MCGIAGVFSPSGSLGQHHRDVVHRLNDWQAHRGPDAEGFWVSNDHHVMFGHRRLAIIDTGISGAQPMHDASGRWTAILNGEIYNYRALRQELERLGRRFLTGSDTEVLINAVAEWGEKALARLRGMFAFALWDEQEKELWLARDPYGIKPLYLAQAHGLVWFASQARAISDCAPVSQKRDAAGLVGFYVWGSIPEPFSWWADIRPLPAGHVQRFTLSPRKSQSRSYYCLSEQFAARPSLPRGPAFLREVMADSVRHHLVADTEVGVFLSAGIDSNVIAALASAEAKGLKSITLAFKEFEGTAHDEAPLAELAARALGTEHHTIRIGKAEFEELLPDFFGKMDQPSIDGLNTYLVSRAAAGQGLKVALSGLGGDELFGGYPSFRQIPRLLQLAWLSPVLVPAGRMIERISRELFPRFFASKLASVLARSGTVADAYLLRRCVFLPEAMEFLLDKSWREEGFARLAEARAQESMLAPLKNMPVHAQIAALESCCYMRNQLLRDADWAGMAHGVEIRVPFVDRVVLESLAPWIASKSPPRKPDLAAVPLALPQELLGRPKTGFVTPVYHWATGGRGGREALAHWARLIPGLMRSHRPEPRRQPMVAFEAAS